MSTGDRLERARCVVCVGPGGVGKTSSSAAIAVEAARRGRRTMVLTIDPAKRLANALGLPEIGNQERPIPAVAFTQLGLEAPKGTLSAMMLDIKRTWDEVITRHHPDPEKRRKLLENKLYVAMSTALAGSQEYMAMEKLYELTQRKDDPLDLIVLDTPPANHAVDFLEAPSKIIDALDNDATRWLLEPYQERRGLAKKLLEAGSSFFIRTIARFTGAEMLDELGELLAGFQGMFEGFQARAQAVNKLLAEDTTQFWVLSTPTQAKEARAFWSRLVERELHVAALVLNRATPDPFQDHVVASSAALHEAVLRHGGSAELAARIEKVSRDQATAAASERAEAEALRSVVGATPVVLVPQRYEDVHDLLGLDAIRQGLFG
jgi:anion-transporting  ArsA/GET3 family ATPase